MEKEQLINILNKDLAEEHAAIVRYLTHAYLEGEDTPIGASLLSRSREEMWHMHWLGMIIGKLGGEPNLTPAPYPFDPTNRETIFQSYIDYELKLVPHYQEEAEQVNDPHIRRVLLREALESQYHAEKFRKRRDKLSAEEASGVPGEENKLPESLVEMLQESVRAKYNQVLQTVRDAWVFQGKGVPAWQRMDFSMTKMKQLAHSAEEIAENGLTPRITIRGLTLAKSFPEALKHGLSDLRKTIDIHQSLFSDNEAAKHGGLMTNLDLTLHQEKHEAGELEDQIEKKQK